MLLEGLQLTRYRIVQQLRSGGRSETYLAVDEYHHHPVAIKMQMKDKAHRLGETYLPIYRGETYLPF